MPFSFSRSIGLAFVLAAVVLALVSPAAMASVPAQAGGQDNWYDLAAGQSVEWQFYYGGGSKPALIAFGVDPANSISVNVYTDDQWRSLGAGAFPVEPVGRGTPGMLLDWSGIKNLVDNGDLFWEAVSEPAVLFHIQVHNTSPGPARYWIAQAGPGTGPLAPYAPAVAGNPTPHGAGVLPTPAPQAQGQQPATAGQATSSGTGAQGSQPPASLPVAGNGAMILLSGVGLVLLAAGWALRR